MLKSTLTKQGDGGVVSGPFCEAEINFTAFWK